MSNTTITAFPTSANQSPSQESPVTPAQWDGLTGAPIDEAMRQTLDAALDHRMDLNRHRTELLRMAADPATTYTLFLLLTHMTAHDGDLAPVEGDDDSRCIACCVRRYAERGLLEPEDETALVTVMTRIARWTVGFPMPVTGDEYDQITHNPQALIRAAYALARDLVA